ncbi:MAG TPA: hypothetical protein VEL73_09210 [Mycobacteriales bacterium]|nr:hypothetical protein [Mycobacteriales bacterium]
MSRPEQERTLRAVRATVEETLAARAGGDRLSTAFAVDATRVAREPAGCLYRVDRPAGVELVEDSPVRLTAGSRRVGGRLGPVVEGGLLVETETDLGPRVVDGRLAVDGSGPPRALRARLAALAPVAGASPDPPTFRFDQAALVLGGPGGQLHDRIATAVESADPRSVDDRSAEVLQVALRNRWAAVSSPPGSDAADLVARLLDRLLQPEASVLVVAPSGYRVDRVVGAVCERLAAAGRLRSGLVQRVGLLAPGAVRDRWGPYVQAAAIAADLRAGLDARLATLDRLDGRLRFDEAERQVAELDRHAADIDDRLGQTVGGRPGRQDDPDALVVRLHALRAQRRSARQAADRIALELSHGGRVPTVEEVLGEGTRTPAGRRRQLAEAREELLAAGARIDVTLRRRCRLVATTTRSTYTRELPRTSFDVVVVVGAVTDPEAYYLAGLSSRSVVNVRDTVRAGDPPPVGRRSRPTGHADSGFHRRQRSDQRSAHPPQPLWRRNPP